MRPCPAHGILADDSIADDPESTPSARDDDRVALDRRDVLHLWGGDCSMEYAPFWAPAAIVVAVLTLMVVGTRPAFLSLPVGHGRKD